MWLVLNPLGRWCKLVKRILSAAKQARHFLHLMVGVPNYDTYVDHQKIHHPDEPIQSKKEFFNKAQEARYNGKDGKISRCC